MGLRQSFKFEYKDADEIVSFIEGFSETYRVENRNGLFIISSKNGKEFTFDMNIESYGLRSERAGEYFEFLGIFIEALTGMFGAIVIEDV